MVFCSYCNVEGNTVQNFLQVSPTTYTFAVNAASTPSSVAVKYVSALLSPLLTWRCLASRAVFARIMWEITMRLLPLLWLLPWVGLFLWVKQILGDRQIQTNSAVVVTTDRQRRH